MGLFHWQKERNSNADFIIICVFSNIGLNKDSGMDPSTGQLTKTKASWLGGSYTHHDLYCWLQLRNCLIITAVEIFPSESKPEHGGIFLTKQRSNIPFIFCLNGTENALKTVYYHWCSSLWRVTAGKSLKPIPRWTKMDQVIVLSHWRKDCLDQFLTCPSAIIQFVFQPEALRWRLECGS